MNKQQIKLPPGILLLLLCSGLCETLSQLADLSLAQLNQLVFGEDEVAGCLVLVLQLRVSPLSSLCSSYFLFQLQFQIFDLFRLKNTQR